MKVLRDLWLHRSRTLLVLLAIAVGIVGAGSVLDTWALLRVVVDRGYRQTLPASATIVTDSIDDALLGRVRAMPAIAAAEARRTVNLQALVQGSWRPVLVFAMPDFASSRIGLVARAAGQFPPPDGAIAIEHSSLDLAGAGVGDTILVRYGDHVPVRIAVSGIARDGGLAPGWMEHIIYAFTTPATLAAAGAPSGLSELQVRVRDTTLGQEAVRRIAFDVKRVVESTGRTVRDVSVPVPFRHIHADQMNSLLLTQAGFGILALLLSAILVVNLITAMLTGQVREIGIMKTLGASPGQLAAMYIVLALSLGILASAIALPVSALIGRRYAEFSAGMLNFEIGTAAIPAWAWIVQVLTGALLPVLAAAIPVLRGCRIAVGDALRGNGQGAAPTRVIRLGGLARPILLGLRNAFRRRQRMALTLLTLATGGAVYLGALNLRASIRAGVGDMFDAMHYDVALRFARPYPAERIENLLRSVDRVRQVEAFGGGSGAVVHADGTFGNRFGITAPDPATRLRDHPIKAGRWLNDADTNALVVGEMFLEDEPSARLGGMVTLLIDGQTTRWTIVGIVAGQSRATQTVYATRAGWGAVRHEPGVDRAVVAASVNGPIALGELRRALEQKLRDEGIELSGSGTVAESRAVMEDHLLMVAGFLLIMSQVMIVVGGLGLASTMSIAVLERTRESGILRAIGARHGAIHAIIQAEGLTIALASFVLALPLSLPMSLVLGNAFGAVMFRMPLRFVPDGGALVLWLAVSVGVSLLACAWPAYRATRVPAARALAWE